MRSPANLPQLAGMKKCLPKTLEHLDQNPFEGLAIMPRDKNCSDFRAALFACGGTNMYNAESGNSTFPAIQYSGENKMYLNIVFDLGGVVFNYSPKDYLADNYFNERMENMLYDAVFGSEEWRMMDRGELSWKEASPIFLRRGRDRDIQFEMQALLDDWTNMLTTRKATVRLMKLLRKKGFSLYYLSNISKEIMEMMTKRSFWKLFEGGVASCEVGVEKPDPAIYRILLDKYALDPQQTILTDNTRANIAAAFSEDITGIFFTDVRGFCRELVKYGIDVYI